MFITFWPFWADRAGDPKISKTILRDNRPPCACVQSMNQSGCFSVLAGCRISKVCRSKYLIWRNVGLLSELSTCHKLKVIYQMACLTSHLANSAIFIQFHRVTGVLLSAIGRIESDLHAYCLIFYFNFKFSFFCLFIIIFIIRF